MGTVWGLLFEPHSPFTFINLLYVQWLWLEGRHESIRETAAPIVWLYGNLLYAYLIKKTKVPLHLAYG